MQLTALFVSMLTQTLRPPDADDDRSDAADHETLVIMQSEELESLECIYGDSFKTVYSKPSYTEMRASPPAQMSAHSRRRTAQLHAQTQ